MITKSCPNCMFISGIKYAYRGFVFLSFEDSLSLIIGEVKDGT